MAKHFFTVAGKQYPVDEILAVVPTSDGVQIRWARRGDVNLKGITSQEVMFKIDEAKASTDND